MEMDFITTRGPRLGGDPIRYTMTADLAEQYHTDGSPRTFYSVCRVRAADKKAFLESILPDVAEGSQRLDRVLRIDAYPVENANYYLQSLTRYTPQQHPIHPVAYAVEASVLGGEGHPVKSAAGDVTFRSARSFAPPELDTVDGYVRIGVTWKDLPYPVTALDDVDLVTGSEVLRYCQFKQTPKGSNLQINEQSLFFVNDSGTALKQAAGDPSDSPPLNVLTPQPLFVPATGITITWRMVPRVPRAAQRMRATVNMYNTGVPDGAYAGSAIRIPFEIMAEQPEVGTMLYLGYEQSDPYYTVSGQKVYDITYNFLHRPGGDGPYRGHNSAFCPRNDIKDFRRVVFAMKTGGNLLVKTNGDELVLPISGTENADQDRWTVKGANVHNFADHANLFRLEASPAPDGA